MEHKRESPWSVANLHEFLYFCCPECDEKKKSEELFIEHALNEHPEAKYCIEQLIVKKEPLELDNVNNPCKVEIMPDIVDQRDPYGLEG